MIIFRYRSRIIYPGKEKAGYEDDYANEYNHLFRIYFGSGSASLGITMNGKHISFRG